MLRVLVVAVGCVPCLSYATLYKCSSQGVISYQEKPCGPGQTNVPLEAFKPNSGQPVDPMQSEKDDAMAAFDYRERYQKRQQRARMCEELLRKAIAAKTELAVWESPQMISAANARRSLAEEGYARECESFPR